MFLEIEKFQKELSSDPVVIEKLLRNSAFGVDNIVKTAQDLGFEFDRDGLNEYYIENRMSERDKIKFIPKYNGEEMRSLGDEEILAVAGSDGSVTVMAYADAAVYIIQYAYTTAAAITTVAAFAVAAIVIGGGVVSTAFTYINIS